MKIIKEKEVEEMKRLKGIIVTAVILSGVVTISSAQPERNELRRELDLSSERARTQELIVSDLKAGEYQDGKTLTDIHGNRVRLEQYILRPRADQIEFISYTKRDTGVDVLRGLSTYNKDLPQKLTEIGETDPKKWGVGKPEYYVKDGQWRIENSAKDAVECKAENGNLYIKVEGSDPLSNDDDLYDVIYENSQITVHDGANNIDVTKVKSVHTGGVPETADMGLVEIYLPDVNSQLNNKTFTINPKYDEGDTRRLYSIDDTQTWQNTKVSFKWDNEDVSTWNIDDLINIEKKKLDWETEIIFADNTKLSHREIWLKDDGEALTIEGFINTLRNLTPENWAAKLSELNHEAIWTATEFNSRSIDVIWSPSIFVKAVTSEISSANQAE